MTSFNYELRLAEHIINTLNKAVRLDRKAMHTLVEHRVPCNKELTAHPTIQVSTVQESNTTGACSLVDVHKVGLLGIINGLVGVDTAGNGYIAGDYDNDGKLIGFVINRNLKP